MFFAAAGGHAAVVELLCAHGVVGPDRQCSLRHRTPFNSRNDGPKTCVDASMTRRATSARHYSADPGDDDALGRTPLHFAAMHDHAETVRALCAKGAWVEAPDAADDTPLLLAARMVGPGRCPRHVTEYHLTHKKRGLNMRWVKWGATSTRP
jgi:ankyrin repeat protein